MGFAAPWINLAWAAAENRKAWARRHRVKYIINSRWEQFIALRILMSTHIPNYILIASITSSINCQYLTITPTVFSRPWKIAVSSMIPTLIDYRYQPAKRWRNCEIDKMVNSKSSAGPRSEIRKQFHGDSAGIERQELRRERKSLARIDAGPRRGRGLEVRDWTGLKDPFQTIPCLEISFLPVATGVLAGRDSIGIVSLSG